MKWRNPFQREVAFRAWANLEPMMVPSQEGCTLELKARSEMK